MRSSPSAANLAELQPALAAFHPVVAEWFSGALGAPTPPQAEGWRHIISGRDTLIAAPTGSGKTLAAFLWCLDELVRMTESDGGLPDETLVVYVSPLKALGNDIERNLRFPLHGIRRGAQAHGLPDPAIRVAVRTGDTPAKDRSAMMRRPPHILVTTPESLYLLLTSEGGRGMLAAVKTVIVDEIHAVVDDKRGAHLALSLERLAAHVGPFQRIGLSATQNPIEDVGDFLVGDRPPPAIVDTGHARVMDLGVEVPSSPLETVMSHEVWSEVYDRLAELIGQHRTTLIFVNTRRLAERVTRHLEDRLGESQVMAHHGSLSKEARLAAEQRLKSGELRAIVATASLELGIDVGSVELVCQLGSTRTIAAFLQRVGRSGHSVGETPKGRIFPLTRDELIEAAALLDSVRRGELDRLEIPRGAVDILAQQIVAELAAGEWDESALFEMVSRAAPYRTLAREDFSAVLEMLADGFSTRRGRRGALIHWDRVNRRLRGRRGARLAALLGGGAIPDTGDYRVLLQPGELFIGTINEDFAIESSKGDIFQLGNSSWRVEKIETGLVRVSDAQGQPPTVPFWLGEAPARSHELSRSVARIRLEVAGRDRSAAGTWLTSELGVEPSAAGQIVDYLHSGLAALGEMPTRETLVAERFFDEAGSMHVVIHAPFGSRVNRAWGLALRKRFCRKFNFELQAAATEDAIILSLGPTHSFPLEEVFEYLDAATVREVLIQALLDAPMFGTRWRWNASRALAVPRRRSGGQVPIQLQRMQAEDLIAVVFPDQLACFENIEGEREIPDHPLVNQTIHDCLTEAMDIDSLERIVADVREGRRRVVGRDLTEPSPLAGEVLAAKPYAFLDDAPLEERRTHAVVTRRWLDPESASSLAALDAEAIARVIDEAWPDPQDPDELHDALVLGGFLTAKEGEGIDPGLGRPDWRGHFEVLLRSGRATVVRPRSGGALWVATERLPEIRAVLPDAPYAPAVNPPSELDVEWPSHEAARELLRGRLEISGPVTAEAIVARSGFPGSLVKAALIALEGEGFAFQGRFTPDAADIEWCDRRLLARIHRYTLRRLRSEIQPVSAQAYLRFLLRWQHLHDAEQVAGAEGLDAVLAQLEGFPAAAAAWETEILPGRVLDFDTSMLDGLAMSGDRVWARLHPPAVDRPRSGPMRSTPIAFAPRADLDAWRAASPEDGSPLTGEAEVVLQLLRERGAVFFDELTRHSKLLPTQVENALGELVAGGRVTSDSFRGLRALLVPSAKRPPIRPGRRPRHGTAPYGVASAGRWWALPDRSGDTAGVQAIVWTLLRRYGVVFHAVLEREVGLPPWRALLGALRRLEARGEIRGGRFVTGFAGEQYALPEAVGLLRKQRSVTTGDLVVVPASDPANLLGIVTPGDKLPATAGARLVLRDGLPVAVRRGGETRFLESLDPQEAARVEALVAPRRRPRSLRSYIGSTRRPAARGAADRTDLLH